MSTDAVQVEVAERVESDAEVVRRSTDLWVRFHRAIFEDTSLLDDIPNGVILVLVPKDDPELAQAETEKGLAALHRGHDVYFRHVRLADLPTRPMEPSAPPVGLRRTSFNWDGTIASQEVCGPDGEWHAIDPPEPVDDLDADQPD